MYFNYDFYNVQRDRNLGIDTSGEQIVVPYVRLFTKYKSMYYLEILKNNDRIIYIFIRLPKLTNDERNFSSQNFKNDNKILPVSSGRKN